MPVVGSSAYNTAGQVMALVRSLVNDAAGIVFTDALVLPFVNSAYRKVQRGLANTGAGTFISDNVTVIVAAVSAPDSSLQVVINDATAPPNQLPTDLLVPLKLWERPASSAAEFGEMTDLTRRGGLPSRRQGAALEVWEWRADGIYFLGATQATQVRIRYAKAYPDLADASSQILVRSAQDAIAYYAAAMAASSRGSPLAAVWAEAGDDFIEDLISAAARREQQTLRRRRPYRWRSGVSYL